MFTVNKNKQTNSTVQYSTVQYSTVVVVVVVIFISEVISVTLLHSRQTENIITCYLVLSTYEFETFCGKLEQRVM